MQGRIQSGIKRPKREKPDAIRRYMPFDCPHVILILKKILSIVPVSKKCLYREQFFKKLISVPERGNK
jgi:hypothetical protein